MIHVPYFTFLSHLTHLPPTTTSLSRLRWSKLNNTDVVCSVFLFAIKVWEGANPFKTRWRNPLHMEGVACISECVWCNHPERGPLIQLGVGALISGWVALQRSSRACQGLLANSKAEDNQVSTELLTLQGLHWATSSQQGQYFSTLGPTLPSLDPQTRNHWHPPSRTGNVELGLDSIILAQLSTGPLTLVTCQMYSGLYKC